MVWKICQFYNQHLLEQYNFSSIALLPINANETQNRFCHIIVLSLLARLYLQEVWNICLAYNKSIGTYRVLSGGTLNSKKEWQKSLISKNFVNKLKTSLFIMCCQNSSAIFIFFFLVFFELFIWFCWNVVFIDLASQFPIVWFVSTFLFFNNICPLKLRKILEIKTEILTLLGSLRKLWA